LIEWGVPAVRGGIFALSRNVTFGPLTRRLLHEASWRDEYPAWPGYANECECLLEFLRAHGQLDRFWPRLTSSRRTQRDEALNEIRTAYLLDKLGYPIVDWEPIDAPPYNVEFAISLGKPDRALVEVKSPGWESELGEEERHRGRTKQDKYTDMEARAAGPLEVIRRTVTKALPKFSGLAASLIVIADDCFVNLGEWGWGPLQMALTQRSTAYGSGLFHDPIYATIGGACLLWVSRVTDAGVKYSSLCLANENAFPSASLPTDLVTQLCTVPIEPVPHIVEPGTLLRF
jgi:hypothetical protein